MCPCLPSSVQCPTTCTYTNLLAKKQTFLPTWSVRTDLRCGSCSRLSINLQIVTRQQWEQSCVIQQIQHSAGALCNAVMCMTATWPQAAPGLREYEQLQWLYTLTHGACTSTSRPFDKAYVCLHSLQKNLRLHSLDKKLSTSALLR